MSASGQNQELLASGQNEEVLASSDHPVSILESLKTNTAPEGELSFTFGRLIIVLLRN